MQRQSHIGLYICSIFMSLNDLESIDTKLHNYIRGLAIEYFVIMLLVYIAPCVHGWSDFSRNTDHNYRQVDKN